MKLSFKRDKRETGLAGIARPYADVKIKGNKKQVGYISGPSRFGSNFWKVYLAVVKEVAKEEPATFEWISFQFEGESEEQAREFVKRNWERFVAKYDLYQFED